MQPQDAFSGLNKYTKMHMRLELRAPPWPRLEI